MAKIVRYNGNVLPFASNKQAGEKYIFGNSTTDSDLLSDQLTAEYLRGWGIVGASDFPPIEWFNSAMFTATQFNAYLHQMGMAEWNATQEYHKGSLANIGGIVYTSKSDSNVGNNPATDRINWDDNIKEVEPRNSTWNGYLAPEHQLELPAPNGYPGNSGGGEVSYAADQEISFGIFAGAGGATASSDSDGWIFTGSTYRAYDYTTAQLDDIDINTVPVYIKDQSGTEYFLKHNGTSVIVTKVGGQLKVEITDAIFAELGITKLWRFFVTERVGRVVELSTEELEKKYPYVKKMVNVTGSRTAGVDYTNTSQTPRNVVITMSQPGAGSNIDANFDIEGATVGRVRLSANASSTNAGLILNFCIMPNETYTLVTLDNISSWWER